MKKKRILSGVLAAVLALCLVLPAAPQAQAASFTDISDSTVADNAEVLRMLGVLDGTGGGAFQPYGTLTRAQADKQAYSNEMRKTLENQENLTIRQGEVTKLLVEDGKITGVKTYSGAVYHCKAVVLCTGTYLKARCIYGDVSNYTGPNGLQAANYLTDSLKELGIEMFRFKTGTPARIAGNTIDYSKMEEQ